jgi:uncharacterized protein involved in tolerance to divalent cations
MEAYFAVESVRPDFTSESTPEKSSIELLEDRLLHAILAICPYEVPEIISLPMVMGFPGLLDWIQEVTKN